MVFIEGNIASGKTTLGNAIVKASPEYTFWEEPVAQWREWGILEAYYEDPRRWGFTMQVAALTTRVSVHKMAMRETRGISGVHLDRRLILERSIKTDRHVFAELNHRLGNIDEREWPVYLTIWRSLAELTVIEPMIVYLRTPAEVCQERIVKRGREEEQNISIEYLKQLEALHDKWLLDRERTYLLDVRGGSPEEAAILCTTWLQGKL